MTRARFLALARVRYPDLDLDVFRTSEMGGARSSSKWGVRFSSDGRSYEYGGTLESIALRLGLCEAWNVLSGGEVARRLVDVTRAEAEAQAARLAEEERRTAEAWGFPPRPVSVVPA